MLLLAESRNCLFFLEAKAMYHGAAAVASDFRKWRILPVRRRSYRPIIVFGRRRSPARSPRACVEAASRHRGHSTSRGGPAVGATLAQNSPQAAILRGQR